MRTKREILEDKFSSYNFLPKQNNLEGLTKEGWERVEKAMQEYADEYAGDFYQRRKKLDEEIREIHYKIFWNKKDEPKKDRYLVLLSYQYPSDKYPTTLLREVMSCDDRTATDTVVGQVCNQYLGIHIDVISCSAVKL